MAPVTHKQSASNDTLTQYPLARNDSIGDEKDAVIAIDTTAARTAGIGAVSLHYVTQALPVDVDGILSVDPSRVTTIEAPISGRLTVDSVVGAHWPTFGEHVEKGAILGRISDALPIAVPNAGIVTHVGAQPGATVQAGQQLLELTDFSQLLARIVWRGDISAVIPSTVTITPLGNILSNTATSTATLLGLAPEVDSITRAPVYLYRVFAPWRSARPGMPITAHFPDPQGIKRGMVVPTDAVVQWQGLGWVYIEQAPGKFIRRRVDTSHRIATGWLIGAENTTISGFRPGERVVVRGAELLLSEEFRSRVTVGEDEDKR